MTTEHQEYGEGLDAPFDDGDDEDRQLREALAFCEDSASDEDQANLRQARARTRRGRMIRQQFRYQIHRAYQLDNDKQRRAGQPIKSIIQWIKEHPEFVLACLRIAIAVVSMMI